MPMMVGTLVRFKILMGLTPTVDATIMTTAATGEIVLVKFAIICIGKEIKMPSIPAFRQFQGLVR